MDSIMTDKHMLYVICPYHIGDILMNGCFCHALQKQKHKKSCILIVCEKFCNIHIDFVGVFKMIYISQASMDIIVEYIIKTSLYETDQYIYGHFRGDANYNAIWDESLCFADRYKKDVFSLPANETLIPPLISNISEQRKHELHSKYHLNDKTVVLMPHAYSLKDLLPDSFWCQLCDNLQSRGYYVYTNIAGNETCLKGTLPIQTNLPELFYLADKIHCFIALRSGITDFLAFSKAKILCVLDPERWYYDLKRNYPGSNSYNYYYIGNHRQAIENFMRQNNVSDFRKVNFSSPYVDSKDIYLETTDLIHAILRDMDSIPINRGATI